MRVVAGRFGGRRLIAPGGRNTRPTSEKVREALFSMLGEISGLRVLDLFAGTGALGIEALSRGASMAVFAEHDPSALKALESNLHTLGLDQTQAQIRRGQALKTMRSARQRHETYDLIFIDPPYNQAGHWSVWLSRELPPLLNAGARVIVESDKRAPLTIPFQLARERSYGETLIRIHHIS